MTTRTYTTVHNPWAIGFDDLFERLNNVQHTSSNYPPYNIIKHDAMNFCIELAVAGFKRSELDIEFADSALTVSAKSETSDEEPTYLHRGLAKRAFTRKWTLADDVVVKEATLTDGILRVELERILPDEKKPRKIEIV